MKRHSNLGRLEAPAADGPNPRGSGGGRMSYAHILTGENGSRPVVRRIVPSDLFHALASGVNDFMAMPSHAIFLCVIYPLLGLLMIGITLGGTMLPLAFPIAA